MEEGALDEELLPGNGEGASSWLGSEEQLAPACPLDCSSHGICDGTVCVCFDGYTGSACEATSETPSAGVPAPVSYEQPSSTPTVTPSSAGGNDGARDGEQTATSDGEQEDGTCPPMSAPRMAGVRCFLRVHPELVPLGIGGGSCLCFIVLLGCAANRRQRRTTGLRDSEDSGYSAADRNSLSDASFEDSRSGSRRKTRRAYGI